MSPNKNPRFTQIACGQYTYDKKNSEDEMLSHCIYGLDTDGNVHKWIPSKGIWVNIEDTVPIEFKDKYYHK